MELKAKLEKPYTREQRVQFINKYNHELEYEIRETVDGLEAWGFSAEEIIAEKQALFDREFFNTSLGYVRREVTMKNGETKAFLADILPILEVGVPILTYTRELAQKKVLVTETFINECKQQVLIDFYGV